MSDSEKKKPNQTKSKVNKKKKNTQRGSVVLRDSFMECTEKPTRYLLSLLVHKRALHFHCFLIWHGFFSLFVVTCCIDLNGVLFFLSELPLRYVKCVLFLLASGFRWRWQILYDSCVSLICFWVSICSFVWTMKEFSFLSFWRLCFLWVF